MAKYALILLTDISYPACCSTCSAAFPLWLFSDYWKFCKVFTSLICLFWCLHLLCCVAVILYLFCVFFFILLKNKWLHRHSFCQFRHTTWTLLLVVFLLLLRDFGTLFHWTVELLHLLTHLRSISRHISLIQHNRTVARASVLWRDINWLIDWLIGLFFLGKWVLDKITPLLLLCRTRAHTHVNIEQVKWGLCI